MGLLDSVLGSVLGGRQQQGSGGADALINIVAGMLANRGQGGAGAEGDSGGLGGLAGLAEQFQRGGLGDVMKSWIGTGQNLPVSSDQLSNVLGSDMLAKIAQQLGVSRGEAASQLSEVLPQVVDTLTPDGHVPEGGFGDIGAMLNRFGLK